MVPDVDLKRDLNRSDANQKRIYFREMLLRCGADKEDRAAA
jgi:hypothetical protein